MEQHLKVEWMTTKHRDIMLDLPNGKAEVFEKFSELVDPGKIYKIHFSFGVTYDPYYLNIQKETFQIDWQEILA